MTQEDTRPASGADERDARSDTPAGTKCRVWANGKVLVKGFPFEQLSDKLQEPDSLVWMDLDSPDHALLGQLADELSLDVNAVEDAVAERERPKLTRYPTHLFITAYAAHLDPGSSEVTLARVSMFVMGNAVITVRRPDFDMDQVLSRWEANPQLLALGPGALVHGLLDYIVDSHFDTVQALDDELETLEDDLFEEKPQTREVQRHSFQLRKSLVQLRRIVLPMREVVGGLQRRDSGGHHYDPELDSYFQDLYDHAIRAAEWTESLRDMVSTIFETNLSLSDTRMNIVMKKLTAWAAIVAVPTAVTGFYGQNVPYPGFDHFSGFLVSAAIIVVAVVGLYIGFRRRDWL